MQRRVNPLPWKEVSPMDEKVKFIAAVCDGSVSIT
ncbi:hypothetical protein LEP1GSC036_4056, partial [Leptospira weilii str. 2006001853]